MCLSARGLPSYHSVAILAGTETHRQDRIAESNPAMRHSDCDNRTTTQDVQCTLTRTQTHDTRTVCFSYICSRFLLVFLMACGAA